MTGVLATDRAGARAAGLAGVAALAGAGFAGAGTGFTGADRVTTGTGTATGAAAAMNSSATHITEPFMTTPTPTEVKRASRRLARWWGLATNASWSNCTSAPDTPTFSP